MWVRFGNGVELGVHFGRQYTRVDVLDRSLVHASLRFGKSEWNHGPRPQGTARQLNTLSGSSFCPWENLDPDPEPLRWGVRKVVSGASITPVETKHPAFSR